MCDKVHKYLKIIFLMLGAWRLVYLYICLFIQPKPMMTFSNSFEIYLFNFIYFRQTILLTTFFFSLSLSVYLQVSQTTTCCCTHIFRKYSDSKHVQLSVQVTSFFLTLSNPFNFIGKTFCFSFRCPVKKNIHTYMYI